MTRPVHGYNPTPEALMSGKFDRAILEREGRYIAWTPTWEGPARPDYVAACADLRQRLREENRP